MTKEMWEIVTKDDSYVLPCFIKVLKREKELREQGIRCRTTYYVNNKPVKV